MSNTIKILWVLILFVHGLKAGNEEPRQIMVKKISSEIKIDGIMDEAEWSSAKSGGDFWLYFPNDTSMATHQTDIKMLYDDEYLYIGIVSLHPGDNYTIPTLKRDFRAGGNDNITLLFDTFYDGQNSFMFGINPKGVLREGLISGGGTNLDGFTTSWDNKWYGESTIEGNVWMSELKIPFSILRFNKGVKKWRFNSYRFDMQSNERSTWSHIPRNQWIFHLGYMGDMIFEEPLEQSSSGISIIPYAIGGTTVDRSVSPTKSDYKYNFGADAKIPISSGLNLDITANPDFSQVEVDRQVTNLDRFEIFFPERRQFFLENEDLFGGFGSAGLNPFFSRRIGIAYDSVQELNVQNAIYGGLRLSGKINEKLRVGLLSIQTAPDITIGQPSTNFSVAAIQHRVGSKSNVAGIFVNRQGMGKGANVPFNRVAGLEYNLISPDNTWNGKTFIHKSFTQDIKGQDWAHGLNVAKIEKKFSVEYRHEWVGADYTATTGFVRRTDYFNVRPDIGFFIFPKNTPKINRHRLGLLVNNFWKPTLGLTDRKMTTSWEMEFTNNTRLEIGLSNDYILLFDDFDPTGTDSKKLLDGTDYNFTSGSINFRSNNANVFFVNAELYAGQYFNGTRLGVNGSINYRIEPIVQFGVNYAVNTFDMPHIEGTRQTYLIGPSIDLTVNKSVFFSTFIQYNSQSQNTNINTRFQWRFAPVSDFFIVYSNNFNSGTDPSDRFTLTEVNRSVVAKVTYWFNP